MLDAQRETSHNRVFIADTARFRAMLGGEPKHAQAVLDALVFLAMAQARGRYEAIDKHGLLNPVDMRAALRAILMRQAWGQALFAEACTHVMGVQEKGLRRVVAQLFDSPTSGTDYHFAHMPDDILGQVYEAWLLHAVSGTSACDPRKLAGVYYTPPPVVRHIVGHIVPRLLPEHATHLRVLDPACGAGAFLVSVYRALLDAARARYLTSKPRDDARLVRMPQGGWRLSFTEKCRLLQAHIFGVDIDLEAVLVTKRALLLMALADESLDAHLVQSLGSACGLPLLDENIKCGNMLVGPDFGVDDASITGADRAAAKPFDWRAAFVPAAQAGGFAAVVGNPPYGALVPKVQKAYLKRRFVHQTYGAETYLLFFELCLRELVRPSGYCGLLIPNPWLTNVKQQTLRKFVLQHAALEQIVHFACAIFKSKAVVDTQIVLLQRRVPGEHEVHTHVVQALDPDGSIDVTSAVTRRHLQAAWLGLDGAPINIFVDDKRRVLAAKIQGRGVPLATCLRVSIGMKPYQVGKGRPKQTRDMVRARIYDADHARGSEYRCYLRGADIRPFIVAPVRRRYIRYGPWLAEPRRAASFETPAKLVMRQTSDHLVAAIDRGQHICMNNLHVLTPYEGRCDLEAWMGVLNSRLMNWYYQVLNPERGEALAEVKKHHLESLPLPDASKALVAIGATARKLARLAEGLPTEEAAWAVHRARLDAQVEALFGLNADEVAVILEDSRK